VQDSGGLRALDCIDFDDASPKANCSASNANVKLSVERGLVERFHAIAEFEIDGTAAMPKP
jgi:hypothetical protein